MCGRSAPRLGATTQVKLENGQMLLAPHDLEAIIRKERGAADAKQQGAARANALGVEESSFATRAEYEAAVAAAKEAKRKEISTRVEAARREAAEKAAQAKALCEMCEVCAPE